MQETLGVSIPHSTYTYVEEEEEIDEDMILTEEEVKLFCCESEEDYEDYEVSNIPEDYYPRYRILFDENLNTSEGDTGCLMRGSYRNVRQTRTLENGITIVHLWKGPAENARHEYFVAS